MIANPQQVASSSINKDRKRVGAAASDFNELIPVKRKRGRPPKSHHAPNAELHADEDSII